MGSHYKVKYSAFIALKYHHYSAQSPSATMYMSHLGMILKILTQQKFVSWKVMTHGYTTSLSQKNTLECKFGHWHNPSEVAEFTTMRKEKWLCEWFKMQEPNFNCENF